MSTISASTTTNTALVQTADTTGQLVFQTGASPTTAMTISSSQVVNFANAPTIGGAAFPSGAMKLISTQTVSAVTTVQFTNLSGYDQYLLIFENVSGSSVNNISLQLGTGSTPTYITTSYYQQGLQANSTTISGGQVNNYSTFRCFPGSLPALPASAFILLNNFTNGADTSIILNATAAISGAVSMAFNLVGGIVYSNSTAKTALRLFDNTANGTTTISGTFSLYGISS